MRIVIDLQGIQEPWSRHRGIGRYSLSLVQHMVKVAKDHTFFLLLNEIFKDSIGSIQKTFEGLLPLSQIKTFNINSFLMPLIDGLEAEKIETIEVIREAFIASLEPDLVLITSFMTGYNNGSITSINKYTKLPTAIILYDLIPYVYSEQYLIDKRNKAWYLNKLEELKQADLFLAISKASAEEAKHCLSLNAQRVVNISSAADSSFRPISISPEKEAELRRHYGLTKPFIMYTGGDDFRKNVNGLIEGFSYLSPLLKEQYQLAIVCRLSLGVQAQLKKIIKDMGLNDSQVILTGYVKDEDLLALYNLCELFVFPSWAEGFGLPALEAMQCGKAVIASNLSSLPEVVNCQEALFDPYDSQSIGNKISEVLTNPHFKEKLEAHSVQQAKQFSWENTAQRALSAIENHHQMTLISAENKPKKKPKLAYISPLPPEKSGISDYSLELLAVLKEWYEIDVVTAVPYIENEWLRTHFNPQSIKQFTTHYLSYDRVLYHIGNSHLHEHMFNLLLAYPGVVVLHDFYLSDIHEFSEINGLRPQALNIALYHSHGYLAVKAYNEAKNDDDRQAVIKKYPANLATLECAIGLIVHSQYSIQSMRYWYGQSTLPVAKIPLMRAPALAYNKRLLREERGYGPDDFIICSFGILTPLKLNHLLLEAFIASSLSKQNKVYLIFAGEITNNDYAKKLLKGIKDAELEHRIKITGWLDQQSYRQYLEIADIGVQLRTGSRGETSGTVLDCMNYGLATIINKHGPMAEINPEAVCMIPDDFSEKELIASLEYLGENPLEREKLGKKAKAEITQHYNPEHCAKSYYDHIEACYSKVSAPLVLNYLFKQNQIKSNDYSALVKALNINFPPLIRKKTLFLDISEWVNNKISRDRRQSLNILINAFLEIVPLSLRVEPIYFQKKYNTYFYAQKYMAHLFNLSQSWAVDRPIDTGEGDFFLIFDGLSSVHQRKKDVLEHYRQKGLRVKIFSIDFIWNELTDTKQLIHDLLKPMFEGDCS